MLPARRSYMKSPRPKSLPSDPDDRMLSLNEAAETSGVNIKRIKQAINENELPVYEFGPHTKRVTLRSSAFCIELGIVRLERDERGA